MNARVRLPLTGLLTGTLFGLGLSISQMTDPAKVLGFLNILGEWDPSLVFAMLAAVLVSSIGNRFVLRKGPILDGALHLPTKRDIDTRLIAGGLIFGAGWGLSGYCPGPALAGITSGLSEPFYFIAAMLVGSQLERLWLLRHPAPEGANET